jgi:quinol monooxygenase YgiN
VAAVPAPAAEKDGVYVLCRFDLKSDADISDYVSKTLSVVPTVRAENGCQMYTLLKDAETDWEKPMRFGERTLWMIEKWDSIEALKAHIDAPHMKAFGPTVRPMRSSGTFHVLQEVR